MASDSDVGREDEVEELIAKDKESLQGSDSDRADPTNSSDSESPDAGPSKDRVAHGTYVIGTNGYVTFTNNKDNRILMRGACMTYVSKISHNGCVVVASLVGGVLLVRGRVYFC